MNDAPTPRQAQPQHPQATPPGVLQSQPQPAAPQAPPVYAPAADPYGQQAGQPAGPFGQPAGNPYPQPAANPQWQPSAAPYGQPGSHGAMYSHYAAQQLGQRPPMCQLAIWAFITSFFIGLLGFILAIMASKRIGNTGERGVGFAMAGYYIGLFVMVMQIVGGLLLVVALIMGGMAASMA